MLNPQQSLVGPLLVWREENGRRRLLRCGPGRSALRVLITEIPPQRTTAASAFGVYLPIIAQYPSPETIIAVNPETIERRIVLPGLTKRAEFV